MYKICAEDKVTAARVAQWVSMQHDRQQPEHKSTILPSACSLLTLQGLRRRQTPLLSWALTVCRPLWTSWVATRLLHWPRSWEGHRQGSWSQTWDRRWAGFKSGNWFNNLACALRGFQAYVVGALSVLRAWRTAAGVLGVHWLRCSSSWLCVLLCEFAW
jgi:hypothetical protein